MGQAVAFMNCLLQARHYARSSMSLPHWMLITILGSMCNDRHFIGKLRLREVMNLWKITQQVQGWAQIESKTACLQRAYFYPLHNVLMIVSSLYTYCFKTVILPGKLRFYYGHVYVFCLTICCRLVKHKKVSSRSIFITPLCSMFFLSFLLLFC